MPERVDEILANLALLRADIAALDQKLMTVRTELATLDAKFGMHLDHTIPLMQARQNEQQRAVDSLQETCSLMRSQIAVNQDRFTRIAAPGGLLAGLVAILWQLADKL